MRERAREGVLHHVFRVGGAAGHPVAEAPEKPAVLLVKRVDRAGFGHREAGSDAPAPTAGPKACATSVGVSLAALPSVLVAQPFRAARAPEAASVALAAAASDN